MSDARPEAPYRPLTEDERADRTMAWAEYRHDYQPPEHALIHAHKAFLAGWDAHRLGTA